MQTRVVYQYIPQHHLKHLLNLLGIFIPLPYYPVFENGLHTGASESVKENPQLRLKKVTIKFA